MFSDNEFVELRDLIYKKSGLFFTDRNRQSLETKVSQRIAHTGRSNPGQYMRYLSSNESGQEWQSLLDSVTVNETCFFRDDNQITAISKNIVPELLGMNSVQKKVRIWSAAASSCDEAYTLAILFAEQLRHVISEWDIKIFATDLNENVLSIGRRGVYDKYSLRNTSDEIRRKYFTVTADNLFMVNDTVKKLVVTEACNLMDCEKCKEFNNMDMIFLRNVLIYFDNNSKQTVIDMCSGNLKRGGYLFLGTAETIPKTDNFKTVFFVNAYGYKKIIESADIYKDRSFAFTHKKLIDKKGAYAGIERRKAGRTFCDMQARCFVIKDKVESGQEARVKEISPFGCKLVLHAPVSVGTDTRIQIGDRHKTVGIVRWITAKKDEYFVGVEFR